MKMLKIMRLVIIGSVLMLFLICISNYDDRSQIEEYTWRFTFISPLTQWGAIVNGVKAADKEFKTNTKIYGSEKLDIEGQIQAIKDAVLTRPDGIITSAPVHSEGLCEAIASAISSGIPVVLVDSDFTETDRNCYIGTDNIEAGRMAGGDMYNITKGKAKIGIIVADLGNPNQQERIQGFKSQISQYSEMEVLDIIECHSERMELLTKIPEMLEEYPEMNALYLVEGIASAVTCDILQNPKFCDREISVVASDDSEEVREALLNDIYDAAIVQQPYEQGYLAVQTLCRILEGENVESEIYTDVFSIDKNYKDEITRENKDIEWHLY